MQEKVSHVNTRDELETLRKQMEILKEETETERKGLDARVQAATASLESQLTIKNEVCCTSLFEDKSSLFCHRTNFGLILYHTIPVFHNP